MSSILEISSPDRMMVFRRSIPYFAFFFILGLVSFPSRLAFAQAQTLQAVPAPAAPSREESSPGSITLDFKEADINTVLRVLSLKSRVNIVAGPEVQGTVTIRLENVPWEKALEVVLRTYGYVYERDGNIIRVTTRDKMSQEPVVTQTYILNYTKATEVKDSVSDMLTERGRIRISERTNTLIITDIPTNLFRIQEIIKKIDQKTSQAFIDSKIVKTDVGVAENLGITWSPKATVKGSSRPVLFPFAQTVDTASGHSTSYPGWLKDFFPITAAATTTQQNSSDNRFFPLIPNGYATGSPTYTLGTLDFTSFSTVLQALRNRTNTKVISNPRIVVLNNQKAQVQVGSQIPLPKFERNETTGSVEVTGFDYRDIGVILNVTPHINSEEEILVELAPEVSSKGTTIDFKDFQMPSFDVTVAKTQVLIRSGETIAIGGLLTDNVALSRDTVPWLENVPLIGKLFRSKSQTAGTNNEKAETIFFITVTMVDTEGQPVGSRIEARRQKKIGGGILKNDSPPPAGMNPELIAAAPPPEAPKVVTGSVSGPSLKTDSNASAPETDSSRQASSLPAKKG